MMRHKATLHPEHIEYEHEHTGDELEVDETSDINPQNSSDENSDDDEIDAGNSDEDSDEESGGEEGDEHNEYNLWSYLKKIAFKNDEILNKFGEAMERNINDGMSEDEAKKKAIRIVLPDIRKDIYKNYTDMLLLWHFAEQDDSHEKVMDTKRKLMEDEDYDAEEAIRYAVKKRKYLIQKESKIREGDLVMLEESESDEDEGEDSSLDEK